jgi:hypothetical protein
MKIITLLYSVLFALVCVPSNLTYAQSAVSTSEQKAPSQVAPPTKLKRTVNPDSIKRAKLTRLRNDVALTDDQAIKAEPIIDAYVRGAQAIKADASLDARSRRQKLAEARQKYDAGLQGILSTEQQQKLASQKEERRARLRAARTGRASAGLAPSGSSAAPTIVQ